MRPPSVLRSLRRRCYASVATDRPRTPQTVIEKVEKLSKRPTKCAMTLPDVILELEEARIKQNLEDIKYDVDSTDLVSRVGGERVEKVCWTSCLLASSTHFFSYSD